MIIPKFKISVTKGKDFLTEIPKFLEALRKNKALVYAPWGVIGEYMIKHSKDGVSRGRIVQTFRKLGIDLMKFVANTERLPNSKQIPPNEISKGLQEFVLPEGQRIKISAYVDDPAKMFADILNDKRAPMGEFLAQLLKKNNLKPEGGQRGPIR